MEYFFPLKQRVSIAKHFKINVYIEEQRAEKIMELINYVNVKEKLYTYFLCTDDHHQGKTFQLHMGGSL